jgi:hypothetical protein
MRYQQHGFCRCDHRIAPDPNAGVRSLRATCREMAGIGRLSLAAHDRTCQFLRDSVAADCTWLPDDNPVRSRRSLLIILWESLELMSATCEGRCPRSSAGLAPIEE